MPRGLQQHMGIIVAACELQIATPFTCNSCLITAAKNNLQPCQLVLLLLLFPRLPRQQTFGLSGTIRMYEHKSCSHKSA